MLKRFLLFVCLACLVGVAALAFKYYRWIYTPHPLDGPQHIYIKEYQTFDQVVSLLLEKEVISNPRAFQWVSNKMSYGDQNIKPGHYVFENGMHNRAIITKLRAGDQTAVDVTIRQVRSLEDLAGLVAGQLAFDSLQLIQYILDYYLPVSRHTKADMLSLYIPNTYEMYWTTDPASFQKRMEREWNRFWTPERKAKAAALQLSETEVYILASIIEKETQNRQEMPLIAGVYLNRLQKNMLLQADPTVVYAVGDFSLRRVLKTHLEIDSPYNTYKYPGLPPGPICMPSINSIDAVLNSEDHNYLYFCAKPGYAGEHQFASSLAGHLRNARVYQNWLNQEGIR